MADLQPRMNEALSIKHRNTQCDTNISSFVDMIIALGELPRCGFKSLKSFIESVPVGNDAELCFVNDLVDDAVHVVLVRLKDVLLSEM